MRHAIGQGRAVHTAAHGSNAVPWTQHWTEHPLHESLVRQTLYLGVERTVLGMEGTLCLALLFGVGFALPALALMALVVLVIHPVMVWVTARDPQATEIAVRGRTYADYYAPHAALHPSGAARAPRPRPSVPGRR